MDCSCNKKDDVVDHVGVPAQRLEASIEVIHTKEDIRDIFQEFIQGLNCITLQVVELVHQELCGPFGNGGGCDGEGFISEKVAIVR